MASRQAVAFLLANPDIAKAYVEGKSIQFRSKSLKKHGEEWTDWNFTSDLTFNERYEYRLKPEPRSVYVLYRGDGTAVGVPYMHEARAKGDLRFYNETHGRNHGPYVLKEFREVL